MRSVIRRQVLVVLAVVIVIDNRSGARLVCGCSFCHGLRHEAGGETDTQTADVFVM